MYVTIGERKHRDLLSHIRRTATESTEDQWRKTENTEYAGETERAEK